MSKRGERSEYLSMSLSSSNENGAVPIIKNKYLTGGMKTIIHLRRNWVKYFIQAEQWNRARYFRIKKRIPGSGFLQNIFLRIGLDFRRNKKHE